MMNYDHLPLSSEEFNAHVLNARHGGAVWQPDGQRSTTNDFSSNIWPYPLDAAMLDRCFSTLDAYPDPDYHGLISAAASYYNVEETQILPANGSTEALYLGMLTLKPRRLAVFEPTFSEYSRAAHWATSSKVEIIHILADVRNGFRPALQVPEADVAIICNPNNPTGVYIPRRELISWADTCSKRGVFVIVDEAFIEFVPEPQASVAHELAGRTDLLVMRSMTKCFGIPGLRLGFALGPDAIIKSISTNRIPWSVNTIAQQCGMYLARNSSPTEMRIAETVARERDFLTDNLQALGWVVLPSAANFLLCRLPARLSSRKLLSNMLKEGFLIRDASNFYGLDDSYVRYAVKQRCDNESLLKTIAKCI